MGLHIVIKGISLSHSASRACCLQTLASAAFTTKLIADLCDVKGKKAEEEEDEVQHQEEKEQEEQTYT